MSNKPIPTDTETGAPSQGSAGELRRSFNMADAIRILSGGNPGEAWANLEGATLVEARKEGDDVVIVTDRGVLRGVPEGDCCSYSWVESVECDAPAGSRFVGYIEDDPERPVPEWHDGDERKVYFGTLVLDRGRIQWEMRNESNGYYGGWLNWSWLATGRSAE